MSRKSTIISLKKRQFKKIIDKTAVNGRCLIIGVLHAGELAQLDICKFPRTTLKEIYQIFY